MQLTSVEQSCLEAIVAKYQERELVVWNDAMVPELDDKGLLVTLRKLQALGLIRLEYSNEAYLRHRLVTIEVQDAAFLYLEGRLRPVPPGHIEVTVQLDPETAAQLCDAVAWIYTGQTDLAEAVRTVAHELRQPPTANRAESIQVAIATISLLAETAPMVKTVLLPILAKIF